MSLALQQQVKLLEERVAAAETKFKELEGRLHALENPAKKSWFTLRDVKEASNGKADEG